MPWSGVNTEYRIHQVQHTQSTAYIKYSIHQVQHRPSTAYTESSIHRVQHTPSPAYTESSIHRVQHIASTAYSEYSISNNPSFLLKHPGVSDCSNSSDRTSYPLTENYSLPVAQATGRVAFSPPLIRVWYTHHQNYTCITLFAGAAVML